MAPTEAIIKFDSYELAESQEWKTRWPSFSPQELACSHCGKLLIDTVALDTLQHARQRHGGLVRIASGYRCPEHPLEAAKSTGPGPHSRGAAFDAYPFVEGGAARMAWIKACLESGFWGFGMGASKLHFDRDVELGPRAWFYGK